MSTWESVDLAAFYAGRDFEAWRWMGARLSGDGADFRVLAPAAAGASVLLGTPGGETREVPMTRCLNGAFLEAHVPGVHEGDAYEYRIYLRGGGFVRQRGSRFAQSYAPAHERGYIRRHRVRFVAAAVRQHSDEPVGYQLLRRAVRQSVVARILGFAARQLRRRPHRGARRTAHRPPRRVTACV